VGWSKSPVLGVLLGIFPVLIPILFIGLHIFVSIIQTYVFTVLPSIYIGRPWRKSTRTSSSLPFQCETGCRAQGREPPTGGNFKEAVMKKAAMLMGALASVALFARPRLRRKQER